MFDMESPVLQAACCAVVQKDLNPYQVCFFNETSCAECSRCLPLHVGSRRSRFWAMLFYGVNAVTDAVRAP